MCAAWPIDVMRAGCARRDALPDRGALSAQGALLLGCCVLLLAGCGTTPTHLTPDHDAATSAAPDMHAVPALPAVPAVPALPDAAFTSGHHILVAGERIDPGPAFDWERLLREVAAVEAGHEAAAAVEVEAEVVAEAVAG